MRLIDADALIEDSKTYLNTLNPDNDGKECAKIYWLINVLNESPAVEQDQDTISRQAAIDAVDSETVSTNPEHFKSSEKFIKFMDDADIASFGKWQWANGFNTAVVAAKIQLKNLPSTQPEIIHCGDCKYYTPVTAHCEIRGKGLYLIRGMEDFCSRAERRTDDS